MAWRVILIETIDWAKEDRIEKSTFKIEHEYSFTSGNCIPVSVNQFIQALMQKGWVLFHCVLLILERQCYLILSFYKQ